MGTRLCLCMCVDVKLRACELVYEKVIVRSCVIVKSFLLTSPFKKFTGAGQFMRHFCNGAGPYGAPMSSACPYL